MNYKIIHIHNDYKFVIDSKKFENKRFENIIIIISNDNPYNEIYNKSALIFEQNNRNFNKILEICNHANLVVLYSLTRFNVKLALKLKPEIKIAWRFFGYELYGRLSDIMLSTETKNFITHTRKFKFDNWLKNLPLMKLRQKTKEKIFLKSINRINYFFGLSYEEYNFLKEYFPDLPEFIQLPPLLKEYNNTEFTERKAPYKIIIGHNGSYYNNHIDILNILLKYNNHDIEPVLIMNYGNENKSYYKWIISKATKINRTHIIKDFMSSDEFENLYNQISAIVINSYRQMGMGNVFIALSKGVKVYLNTNNVMYNWLKNEGFLIFSINDFEDDVKSNSLYLNQNQAYYNIECYKKMINNKYTVNDFQEKVMKVIMENNIDKYYNT